MKIRYDILWFDDDPEAIKEHIEPWLHRVLDEMGFVLKFLIFENYSARPPGDFGKFDLIVTDLNLGDPNASGRTIIDEIRNGRIYTDVLIYSANADALAASLAAQPPLERISICPSRGELERKLREVVLLTVRKAQSIPYVRGQFIAQAIDLEEQMNRILQTALAAGRFPSLQTSRTKMLEKYKKDKSEMHAERISALESFGHDKIHVLCDQQFLDASDRQRLARHILKDLVAAIAAANGVIEDADLKKVAVAEANQLAGVLEELKTFQEDVLKIRNTLAHVKEEERDGVCVIKSKERAGTEIIVNEEWCTTQRTVLRKHVRNLEKVLGYLSVDESASVA